MSAELTAAVVDYLAGAKCRRRRRFRVWKCPKRTREGRERARASCIWDKKRGAGGGAALSRALGVQRGVERNAVARALQHLDGARE